MNFKGNIVKKLKEEKANDIDIQRAVAELKARKNALETKVIKMKLRNLETKIS